VKIKVGVSTSLRPWNPAEVFHLAEKYGLGVELVVFRWQTLAFWQRLRKKFPSVKILGVHAPFCGNYSQYWENIKADNLTIPQRIMQTAWPILMGDVRDNPAARIANEFSCPLIMHPKAFLGSKVQLPRNTLLENPAAYEDGGIYTPESFMALVKKHDLGTVFDPEHAVIPPGEWNIVESFLVLGSRYIHFSDYKDHNEHLIPGEGETDFSGLVKTIREQDNDIVVIMELKPYRDSEEALYKTLTFLGKKFAGYF